MERAELAACNNVGRQQQQLVAGDRGMDRLNELEQQLVGVYRCRSLEELPAFRRGLLAKEPAPSSSAADAAGPTGPGQCAPWPLLERWVEAPFLGLVIGNFTAHLAVLATLVAFSHIASLQP